MAVADIPEYIVVTEILEEGHGYDSYHYWDGRKFSSRAEAFDHGTYGRGGAPFLIGRVIIDHLVHLSWMLTPVSDGLRRRVAEQIGLNP